VNVTGLPVQVKVADLFFNVIGFKDNFLGYKTEQVSIVYNRHVIAPEFLHPDNGLMRIVSALKWRDHMVYQILGNHNDFFNFAPPMEKKQPVS
jgi:hypothetical protein